MIIIKKIDDIGRIAIPKDVRRSLQWMGGDEIELQINNDNSITLRKHHDDNAALDQLKTLQIKLWDNKEIYETLQRVIDLVEKQN